MDGFAEVYEYIGGVAEWGAYGLPFEGRDADVVRAGDVAEREFPVCGPDEQAGEALASFGEHTVCAVVDGEGVFLGRLRRSDAESHPESPVRELMAVGASTFRPDVHVSEMADWFGKRSLDEFFITTPDGKVFGVLYRIAVEHVLHHAADE